MSIIEEALRRTHEEGGEATLRTMTPATVREPLAGARTHQARSSAPAFTVALIALGAFGATLLIRYSLAKSPTVVPAARSAAVLNASPTLLPPTSMPVAPLPSPAFTVSGVMISQGELPLAIVNGRIVAEGDALDGAVVERIDQSRVVLRAADGQELSLAVAR